MNKAQWLNKYEDELQIAFQNTTEEQFLDFDSFVNHAWKNYDESQTNYAITSYEISRMSDK